MNKKLGKNFVKILSVAIATCSLSFVCNISNAATRAAVRGTPVSRKPVTNAQTVATQTAATVVETTSEPAETIAEPEIFENKSSQFGDILSGTISGDDGIDTSDLAEQIRKQRAAADARDNIDMAQTNLQNSLRSGKNACDSGLRQCMQKTCGDDFTKCATDGDTIFGDKLNKCRRDTNCTSEEFNLFTAEIKADRDMNVQLASYNAVINCGNNYNACIQNECDATFTKCLGKTAADAAIKKCATIAKNCTQQDSGLAARFGKVIGELRGVAEKDVKTDEARMYELRKLMRTQCERLGAMFDERSFDCVYTVNFFAGDNQTTPTASRKLYAGDTFFCNQEWFGTNVTTYKENAYRETRAQTAASSAMLGSGVGTAVGLWTSGAIGRALDTQKANKALKIECVKQGGKIKDGQCYTEEKTEVVSKDKTQTSSTFEKEEKTEEVVEEKGNKEDGDKQTIEDLCSGDGITFSDGKCTQVCGRSCADDDSYAYYCNKHLWWCNEGEFEIMPSEVAPVLGVVNICDYSDPGKFEVGEFRNKAFCDEKGCIFGKRNLENDEVFPFFTVNNDFCFACKNGEYIWGPNSSACTNNLDEAWCFWRKEKDQIQIDWDLDSHECKCLTDGQEWDTNTHNCVVQKKNN